MSSHCEGETTFQMELEFSTEVAKSICSQRRLSREDADDFRSYVMSKLSENDYAWLRRFEGRSTLETYIVVVVHRLYLDYIDLARQAACFDECEQAWSGGDAV